MPRSLGKTNDEMWRLARRMNQMAEDWMHAGFRGRPEEAWQPAVDVIECEAEIHVLVELAGMKSADIKVCIEQASLTLSGCRELGRSEHEITVHQLELARGPFHRTVPLPHEVDAESAKVKYAAGLLEIAMQKCREQGKKTTSNGESEL